MLHRQHGIRIPDNTLSDWVGQASELFRLVYGAMLARQRRKSGQRQLFLPGDDN